MARTNVVRTHYWSGHLKLLNLKQGGTSEDPYPMYIDIRLMTGQPCLYVVNVDDWESDPDWASTWGAWQTASGYAGYGRLAAWEIRTFFQVEGASGPRPDTVLHRVIMGYTYVETDPGVFVYTWHGPDGGEGDSFEFDWEIGFDDLYLAVESSSNSPSYRERQVFTDDKVTYTGWQGDEGTMCRVEAYGASETYDVFPVGTSFPSLYGDLGLSIIIEPNGAIAGSGIPPRPGYPYCELSIEANGEALPYLGELNMVSPNGTTGWTNYPNGDYPDSSRWLVSAPADKIGISRLEGSTADSHARWDGYIMAPYILRPSWQPRDFDDTEAEERELPRLDLGGLILDPGLSDWLVLPTYSWKDYAAEVINPVLTATMVEEELDALDLNPQVERANNPEDPEGAKTVYHDRRCKLWAWPLTESDYTNAPFFNDDPDHRVLYIYQTGSINVNLPPGLGTRPSSWTAGTGATVDGSNNDLWTIAAGQEAATVYRDLETRFYYQMERLADHLDDPDYWHDEDAPRKLKANLPVVWEGYDEEDEGHVAVMEELSKPEDVTNWSNRSYLYAKLVGGAGLAVKVRLTYSTVEITDPWYTDFAYRFGAGGPYGEAEWEWSRTDGLVVTYSVDRDGLPMVLEAGDNELWVDLACPDENLVPILQHVDKIEFLFDSSDLTEPAQVTLDILSLRPSDREGDPWYETQHFLCDSKQAWDWYRRNFFGVGWVFDGLPNAQVDMYGHRKFVNEKGFCYLHYRRHSPAYTGPFSDLTTAYPLSHLADLFSWQEGFAATYDADALAYYLTDADGNSLGTPAWWWIAEDVDRELRDDDHEDGPQQLRLGVCVGTLDITHARGVPMVLYAAEGQETAGIEKHLGGKPHGIAKRGQKRARMKGGVRVYWRETAEGQETEWALLGSGTPDRHGRWRGPNCIEDGTTGHTHDRSREYRVSRGAELGAAVNRSYWWEGAAVQVQGGGGLVSMYTDPTGVEWCAWVQGTNVYLARKENAPHTWGTAQVIDSSGDYDSASVTGDGRKISVACHKISDDKVYEFLCDSTGAKTSGPFLIGN